MLDKAVTKEFKSIHFYVYDFRLGRVQCKASIRGPRGYLCQGAFGFCESLTLNHEVVRVSSHLEARSSHHVVQLVQI